MWRWPFIVGLLLINSSFAAPVTQGPTSEEEAVILWSEGQKAYEEQRHMDAIHTLERLVARYPGQPGYVKAHFLLAKSFLALDRSQDAISPLKAFIELNPTREDSIQARLALGDAYVSTKKFQEAYLLGLELDRIFSKYKASDDFIIENLLIKSRAQLGLKHEDQALASLSSAERMISPSTSLPVQGKTSLLSLKYKLKECSLLPTREHLREEQILDQLERKGLCLLEALLIYQKALKSQDQMASGKATEAMVEGFNQYRQACQEVPPPPRIHKASQSPLTTRTPDELRRYRQELKVVLQKNCKKNIEKTLGLLSTWSHSWPKSTQDFATNLTKALQLQE